ncbi:MAG TPA: IPExxxVDY family protein [Bacteroidia bacterium]|jgi:hypothetical protein|nr:IPExxxVDY family protein [Bacteroidia bacterium]
MAKYVLENVYDFDFSILAISSSEPDYKLCIHLNRLLNINLVRENPVDLSAKNMKSPLAFSCFCYEEEENFNEYMLLSNRSTNSIPVAGSISTAPSLFDEESPADMKGFLVPELTQCDFLLVLKGEGHETLAKSIQPVLKNINFVQAVQNVNPETLPSKKNLIL